MKQFLPICNPFHSASYLVLSGFTMSERLLFRKAAHGSHKMAGRRYWPGGWAGLLHNRNSLRL